MHLMSIEERLNRPDLSKLEKSQREVFTTFCKSINTQTVKALSISCGGGLWDYLCFKSNQNIKEIVATDIVECPVVKKDRELLRNFGKWDFVKVDMSGILPFDDNSFDLIFHQDVIEHTTKPYKFLTEQYRILKTGGTLLCGTPNLFRPANIVKLMIGKLNFPVKIGWNEEIGDYIHVQEFYEQQLRLLLEEIGFNNVQVKHCYFGLSFLNISFSMYPQNNLGKLMSHFLVFTSDK